MRHRKIGRKFNRTASHRYAMIRNMGIALFQYESIKSTLPKAKELRRFVEPLITLAKIDSVANRRKAFQKLHNKFAVNKLFEELGPRYEKRFGGYIRILKLGFRKGDCANIAYIELMDKSFSQKSQ